MASTAPHDAPVAVASVSTDDGSYIDWPAIIAGAVLASAISLLLMTFGSAVGLSFTDPFGREGVSLFWIAVAMAIWVVWVQVSSFMAGGYVAGRMRRRKLDSTEHESDVRDGVHGLLVWATGLVLTAILAFGGLGALASGAANITGAAAGAAVAAAGDEVTDPFGTTLDLLFRGDGAETPEAARAEVGRILVGGVTGDGVSQADREYLASVVATRTGISQDEAEARVNQVIADAQRVQAEVVEAARQARRIAILVAFLTAASLVVSAAGAWFAATMGGNHRDKQTIVPFFERRVR